MDRNKQEAIIEAILFSMGDAVSVEKLAEILEIDKKDIEMFKSRSNLFFYAYNGSRRVFTFRRVLYR